MLLPKAVDPLLEKRFAGEGKCCWHSLLLLTGEDLLFFNIPQVPIYYRTLPGGLTNSLMKAIKDGVPVEQLASKVSLSGVQKGMLQGDLDNGYITIGNLKEELSVAQIFAILMKGITD